MSISGNKIFTLTLSITAHCEIQEEVFEQWQNDAYTQIINAYEEKLALFQAEQEEALQEAEESGKIESNKQFNRTTE